MRKTLLFIVILCAVVSCFDGSTYSESNTAFATFEYNVNYSDLFGKDSIYCDTTYKKGISWESLAFYHQINEETSEFEGGFVLSYLYVPASGNTDGLSNNEFRVNARDTLIRNTYVVFSQTEKMPEHDIKFVYADVAGINATCLMNSCYVNNTVAVAEAVAEKFVPGDKLVLRAFGYLDGKETGKAEIMLAEKTTAKDSIVSSWTEFDLSQLGSIDYVDFEFDYPAGKDMPLAVCIDNVIANISLSY